ncbi:MAG: type II secretion system F family protein [Planctomycetota bacterium]
MTTDTSQYASNSTSDSASVTGVDMASGGMPALGTLSQSPSNMGLSSLSDTPLPKQRVSQRDIVAATSQLSILLRSGMDLGTSLESVARQTKKPAMKKLMTHVHERVMAGLQFSEALSIYQRTLGASFVASVRAGEASGKLAEVLVQLSQLQRQQMRLAASIRAMLAYPIVLTVVSSSVVLALMVIVLPRFATIFADFDATLPGITRVLLTISGVLTQHGLLVLAALGATIVGVLTMYRSESGRRVVDGWVLNFLPFGYVTRPLFIGRACRLLGMMIENGVPVLEAIQLTRASTRNREYRDLFTRLETEVVNGRGLGSVLLDAPFVPDSAAELLSMAEKSGSLELVTKIIGDHYEEEGETRLREIVNYAEPALTVGMGLVISVVIMAVMLPMFDLATIAG